MKKIMFAIAILMPLHAFAGKGWMWYEDDAKPDGGNWYPKEQVETKALGERPKSISPTASPQEQLEVIARQQAWDRRKMAIEQAARYSGSAGEEMAKKYDEAMRRFYERQERAKK